MAPRKQEMVYIPEAPLLHGLLLEKEKGIAKHYKSVHGAFSSDLKLPCIVFGGHPSLRSGPMVNLLHMWGNKATNTIVFIGKETHLRSKFIDLILLTFLNLTHTCLVA